jgi:CHAD domain-containing protein
MSYRIKKGESLAAAFGRIASEELKQARAELRRPNHAEAVHSARKALKRLRALLRSLRVTIPRDVFRAENRRIADAGRKISPLRDVYVQLRTLGKLKGDSSLAGEQVRRQLLQQQCLIMRRIPVLRKTVRAMLDVSRQELTLRPLPRTRPRDVAAGLKRIYRQGREAFKNARRLGTPDALHAWRKKAKSLGYGLELIRRLGDARLGGMLDCTDDLTEALGNDHDLFMVLRALQQENRHAPAGDYKSLARRIALKRAKLQKRAFKLGRKLYDEKPGPFGRRLDRFFRRATK